MSDGDFIGGPERDRLLYALHRDTCPDCGHLGMRGGPRGGAAQNIFCEQCGSGFNVAPPRGIIFVQRIASMNITP